jgi:carbonic anhydrase
MCNAHSHETDCLGQRITYGRRDFLRLTALGASAALFFAASGKVQASGQAKALMLSCMDYRLVDDLAKFMEAEGLKDNYDHVVLAGASLGAVSDKFKDWHDTFWQHLDVAIKLHNIHEVIVIDHRDCGAYKLALGADAVSTPEKETSAHTTALTEFAALVKSKHAKLEVKAYLMALDGTTETIAV